MGSDEATRGETDGTSYDEADGSKWASMRLVGVDEEGAIPGMARGI
jgi:hypothetical protein